jgi:proline iminopeptidase
MKLAWLWFVAAACGHAARPASKEVPVVQQGAGRAAVNGAELAYEVHGRGPIALALPGGPGFGAAYLRMPEVEKHLTVIYVDLVGTGNSARLSDPTQYRRSRDVIDVEALREKLELGRVFAIGHSYGGMVALEHALAHPDALAGLILYDTAPMTNGDWQADVAQNLAGYANRPWFAAANPAWQEVERATTEAELNAAFAKLTPFYVRDYEADPTRWQQYFGAASLAFDRATKGTSEPYDIRARLPEIEVPALVLVGATDFICSPKMAAILDDKMPASTLVTFEHSGHFAHVEETAAFTRAIAQFVKPPQ